jgi:hypothetical protein
MNDVDAKKHIIAVIEIQMETLAKLPSVKTFIELDEKRRLVAQTLPEETDNKKEGEE